MLHIILHNYSVKFLRDLLFSLTCFFHFLNTFILQYIESSFTQLTVHSDILFVHLCMWDIVVLPILQAQQSVKTAKQAVEMYFFGGIIFGTDGTDPSLVKKGSLCVGEGGGGEAVVVKATKLASAKAIQLSTVAVVKAMNLVAALAA
jgi:hypothetical protein